MIRRPPRSTQSRSSAASDVYKRQLYAVDIHLPGNNFSNKGRSLSEHLEGDLVTSLLEVVRDTGSG